MKIILIRHGMTAGNRLGRYIGGRTDEVLCTEGINQMISRAVQPQLRSVLAEADSWIFSPMLRCLETGALILNPQISEKLEKDIPPLYRDRPWQSGKGQFSDQMDLLNRSYGESAEGNIYIAAEYSAADIRAEYAQNLSAFLRSKFPYLRISLDPGLRECDFGLFENRNYKEMAGDPLYQAWVDSGGTADFPEGESPAAFSERTCKAFGQAVLKARENQCRCLCFLVHGGTIMSVMDRWGRMPDGIARNYYDWHVKNGYGYITDALFQPDTAEIRQLQVTGEL